jgi:hypothetical protein
LRLGLVLAAVLFATFALPAVASAVKYPLILEKTGTGEGTVTSSPGGISCGTSCVEAEASFLDGTKVTLTASPKVGSYFEGWSGCDAEPSATKCEITVTEEEPTVEAEFNEIEKFFLTLEKTGTGQGTVTSSPTGINCGVTCEHEYLEGTKVTLTASASAGSVFEGWSGCDAEPSPTTCEITIVEETTVEAEFNEIEKFKLTVIKSGTGKVESTSPVSPKIVCGSECEKEFEEGTKVTLSKTADPGSNFVEWTGACTGSGACEVTMSAAKEVTAEFKLSANPTPSPTPTPTPEPEKEGTAKAAATASVSGGKAALKLTCSGGTCKGTLKLTAKVKQGKKKKNVVIGQASFSLAAGASTTLKVKLSGAAKKELNKGKTLKAKLSGTGITGSTVKLKPA